MTDTNEHASLSEFSGAWADFERRLSEFLPALASPTLNGLVKLRAPAIADHPHSITIETRIIGAVIGVDIRIDEQRTTFYPLAAGAESMPEAAHDICRAFRGDWEIAHPSLLTAHGDGIGSDIFERLGVSAPEQVLDEAAEHQKLRGAARRIARRGVQEAGGCDIGAEELPTVIFPQSPEHLRSAIEGTLDSHFLRRELDIDGDYIVDAEVIGAARVYVTLLTDRPLIRVWKVIVGDVNSRASAVIEANYLNRTYPLTKWILLGHSLVQELFVSATPFVPKRFIEALHDFDTQYDDNFSQLRLRLGGDDR
ncbi:hypothetical protein BH09ACT6_BH09ACT6_15450 [soil metagenome]